ncbi:nitrate- and nitrite sensing domain-containing protein [Kitasatospora sp. NPDC057904]|uniref:sensor histidine kinase n=1 Tax=unclassified Kitasatospora TaxID=2633591 RepID=UPI0036DF3883
MISVVSVLTLWAFATVSTARGIWELHQLKDIQNRLLDPIDAVVTGLQTERDIAGQLLAAPGPAAEDRLRAAAAITNGAAAELRFGHQYNVADAEGLGEAAATRLDTLDQAIASLPGLRDRIATGQVDWTESYRVYTSAVEDALDVLGAVAPPWDNQVTSNSRVLLELARSQEQLAREDALLRAGQAAGTLTDQQLRDFGRAVHTRRAFLSASANDLRPADQRALHTVINSTGYQQLQRHEDAIAAAPDGIAAIRAGGAGQWAGVAGPVSLALQQVHTTAGSASIRQAGSPALGAYTVSGAATALGLVAVVVSLIVSVRIGRGLVTELNELRSSALDLARRKLPETIRRLHSGEELDLETEAPLPAEGDGEISQVHRALAIVQRAAITAAAERAAVAAAVQRAEVLSGVSGVFVNLARRTQVLVNRQLSLLDAMERRAENPDELADLFRLDHLTTRMRRHAEGLIILSGAAPGRAWHEPVPLVDVVRAAVCEVEDYTRVEVHQLAPVAVAGSAVADLIHLLAELVENATAFSPPHTKVLIHGERVGNGFVVEIEDRGLGLGPDALADANRRIKAAEQADLLDNDRLGLFVVSRLAGRQGAQVALKPSVYGGITAVILLPDALVIDTVGTPGPATGLTRTSAQPTPRARLHPLAGPVGQQPVMPGERLEMEMPDEQPVLPGGSDELPLRVRQANLVPQLRHTPPPMAPPQAAGPSPEQARAAMAAYQQGWTHGQAGQAERSPRTQRPIHGEGEFR